MSEIKEATFIEDDDGNKIPYLKKDPKLFFRKIISLFGETESGKSTIIQELCVLLKDSIPNVIVFAPTNDSNNLYTGKVSKACIFKKITMEILEEINRRQKDAVQIYTIANDMEIMRSIFVKFADDRMKTIANSVNRDAARYLQLITQMHSDPSLRRIEKVKIETMRDKALREAYSLCIKANSKTLLKDSNLTQEQYVAVQFHEFVPDLLLIFDDCASFFMEHKNEQLIRDMFYMGRHDALTSIFSFQGDKDIPPPLRRAAHVSFFTTPPCAMAYINCKDNGITGDLKKKMIKATDRIFRNDGDMTTFRKLAYLRLNSEKIQVTLANTYDDFTMGGLWVRKYLQAIEPKSLSSGKNKNLINEIISITRGNNWKK